MQIKAPEFCHMKAASKNWRNWQCSALFLSAIKGFIIHSVHGSPLKREAFSSKEWLGVRNSLVNAYVLTSQCYCLDHLGNANGFK